MTLTKISTPGIKDDAITSGKIPANAVGSSEIASNAVTAVKLILLLVTLKYIQVLLYRELKFLPTLERKI